MINYAVDASCPLDGIRVLDLSRLVAGNQLTLFLADFGAEVIKIERPGTGDTLRDWKVNGISVHWKVYARNKKSITLNLKHPQGRELLLRLVPRAHVLVESFVPGTMEKIGLGPEVLHERNPRLIIVRISGWGQTGPYSQKPGFGTLVEAMSGFAAMNGFPDREPVLPPMSLADMVAGLYGAAATLVALRTIEVGGGEGQVIDVPLFDPLFAILGPEAAIFRITGRVRERLGSRSANVAPRNVYRTKDNQWIAISASTQTMAERLFRAIGQEALISDPRFRTNSERVKNVDELDAIIGTAISKRTLEENLDLFEKTGVTAAPVYTIDKLLADPHVQARQIVVEVPDPDGEMRSVPMHNIVPRLQKTPGAIRRPAPRLGQHNSEIFGELGLSENDLAELAREGVI